MTVMFCLLLSYLYILPPLDICVMVVSMKCNSYSMMSRAVMTVMFLCTLFLCLHIATPSHLCNGYISIIVVSSFTERMCNTVLTLLGAIEQLTGRLVVHRLVNVVLYSL